MNCRQHRLRYRKCTIWGTIWETWSAFITFSNIAIIRLWIWACTNWMDCEDLTCNLYIYHNWNIKWKKVFVKFINSWITLIIGYTVMRYKSKFYVYINIKSSASQNNNLIINISFSIVIATDKCTRDNEIYEIFKKWLILRVYILLSLFLFLTPY